MKASSSPHAQILSRGHAQLGGGRVAGGRGGGGSAGKLSPRVVRFGLFEAKKQIWIFFFKLAGLKIFENLSSRWPFLVYRSLYSKIQNFSDLKTELGIFQLQAPVNPNTGLLENSANIGRQTLLCDRGVYMCWL